MNSIEMLTTEMVATATADRIDQLSVGVAIVDQGKILLVTRAEEEDVYPGHVELPGGGVDPGEDLLEAVEREMQEETGLTLRCIDAYLSSFDYTLSDGRTVRQFNFLVSPETLDVRLNPAEHSAFHWWDRTDASYLQSVHVTPLMKQCIEEIGAILK